MSDEGGEVTRGASPSSSARRVPPIGLALAAVAAFIFVGGTLLSVLSANDDTPEEATARPTLSALMADTQMVVRAEASSVLRLGEPRDAGVLAEVTVEEVVVAPEDGTAPRTISLYDQGFRESWGEGQHMLLFLGPDEALPEGAEFRVKERCVLDEGGLPCPYEEQEIKAATNN